MWFPWLSFLKKSFGELPANVKVEWFEGFSRKEEIWDRVFTWFPSGLWVRDSGRSTDCKGGAGRV